MEVHYQEHVFGFEPLPGKSFEGRLVLDDIGRELLARLVAAQSEFWALDAEGERLPAGQLFALSPWSCPGPAGPVKLLCRFLNLRDGSVLFDTPESYPGELFRWVRSGAADELDRRAQKSRKVQPKMNTEIDFIEKQIQKRLSELGKKYPQDETTTLSDAAPRQSFLADLSHADRKVRCEAAFALGDLGDSRAILPLAKAFYSHERRGDYLLYDEPDDVQLAIAMALFCLGESEELSTVFTSESGHLRPRIVKALREIDNQRAVKILMDALLVRAHALSYWATRALGELRDRRALEPLLKVLQQHSVEERVAAADSLAELGDERAVPALERAREKDREDKNWTGRTVSQAATMAIDEILRSKGMAPYYASQDSRYIEWVRGRFQYEAEMFVAEVKRKQGVTLAYDESSVAWLDSYINDIRDNVSPEEREGLVRDFSTFLGECLRHRYGGKWKPVDGRWAIAFDDKNAAFPFTKVSKFLEDREDSILSMFRLIPFVFKIDLPAQKSMQYKPER